MWVCDLKQKACFEKGNFVSAIIAQKCRPIIFLLSRIPNAWQSNQFRGNPAQQCKQNHLSSLSSMDVYSFASDWSVIHAFQFVLFGGCPFATNSWCQSNGTRNNCNFFGHFHFLWHHYQNYESLQAKQLGRLGKRKKSANLESWWVGKCWSYKHLACGNMIKVFDAEVLPAYSIAFYTADCDADFYLKTTALDGEEAPKCKLFLYQMISQNLQLGSLNKKPMIHGDWMEQQFVPQGPI